MLNLPEINNVLINETHYPRDITSDSNQAMLTRSNENVDRYIGASGNRYNIFSDPTYLGFRIDFDFITSELFAGSVLGGNGNNTDKSYPLNSALGYLSRTGQDVKLRYLSDFINTLYNVNRYTPWYWQAISGIENAWQIYNDVNRLYRGGDDSKLEITTLESIDWKITGMMDLFRAATFDFDYNRYNIPTNLLYFTMYVHVEDIRSIQSIFDYPRTQSEIYPASTNGVNSAITDSIRQFRERMPRYTFKFIKCRFESSDGSDFFGSMSNSSPESATTKVVLKYEDVNISSTFPWVNYDIDDHPKPSIKEKDYITPEARERKNAGKIKSTQGLKKDESDILKDPTTGQPLPTGIRKSSPFSRELDKIKGTINKDNILRSTDRAANRLITGAITGAQQAIIDASKKFAKNAIGLDNVYGLGSRLLSAVQRAGFDALMNDAIEALKKKDKKNIPIIRLGSNLFPTDTASYTDMGVVQNVFNEQPNIVTILPSQNVYTR